MTKPLQEMSLEELWQLFPIELKAPDQKYAAWYEAAKQNLLALLQDFHITRISHIGSTAVPGLIAKPIVDILLELPAGYEQAALTERLTAAGWLLMNQQADEELLDFNRGYTPAGFAEKVFHLHVKPAGDWGELYFRDYLIAHPDVAQDYAALKKRLKREFEHDRDAYTDGKGEFVRRVTELGREEFAGRYRN
ncbi:GrpB family protein [Lacticaseibacillus nasuensis]|uniref:GrpB family protein n=1 Tax=Lacticaseibacillus nasuensis JCM 17158 TaxID=1291734 RepID=A0A0R1JSD5_9LACO|nr:GrpB family protein [Lacticaseibacillus nasuensis]KRK74261.1 hypothetical protein FD02_GL000861 [Lacticaseibacillus nasuensis JCM 17158]